MEEEVRLPVMLKAHSLFTEIASTTGEENFNTLFEKSGVKIERIDSHGQASPEGFWYDQPQDEWVLLVKGDAVLEIADQPPLTLKAGDHVLIPAHIRHRVANTSADALWVAVHVSPPSA
jgi:cupin 2 domain-containing protein